MSFFYLSIFLSVIIGLFLIAKLRSYDIYEKEAFTSMVLAFTIGGISSVIIALLLYRFLNLFGIDNSRILTVYGSFVFIGPVEEFAKLAGLIIVYAILSKEFNEITDGVLYISCVALGFSIIENFLYANGGPHSEHLLVTRVFISTPAHISCSCLIGYAYYRYKKESKSFVTVIYAFLFASILHGIFDALAISNFLTIILFLFLWIILYQSFRIVQYTNIISPFRPRLPELLDTADEMMAEGIECPHCGSAESKLKFTNRYFIAYKCDKCGYHITSLKYMKDIFRIFAPEYKRFGKKIFPVRMSDQRVFQSVYGAAYFREGASVAFFNATDLAERIGMINQTMLDRFRKSSLIPGKLLSRIID